MYAVAYWNSRQSRRAEFVHAGTVRYGAPVDILKAVLIVTTAVRAVHLRGSKCHKNTKLIRTRCVSQARNTQKLVSTGAFPRNPMAELMTLYNPSSGLEERCPSYFAPPFWVFGASILRVPRPSIGSGLPPLLFLQIELWKFVKFGVSFLFEDSNSVFTRTLKSGLVERLRMRIGAIAAQLTDPFIRPLFSR